MEATAVTRAVIAGSGTMGVQLAGIFAGSGMEVTLWNRSARGLERAAALAGRVRLTTEEDAFSSAQFILECITEDLEAKQDFLSRISRLAPADCLIASNTSGLSVSALGEAVAFPGRFAGMHWINPPALIPLVEVVRGRETAPETAEAVFQLAQALGKRPICTRDVPGFLLNRLQFAVLREAFHLVESGAAGIQDVDDAVRYGLGMRYACGGPFRSADLGGLDVFRQIAAYLFPDLSNSPDVPELLDQLCARGDLGTKTGRGFYDYDYGDGGAAEAAADRDRRLRALAQLWEEMAPRQPQGGPALPRT